MEEEESTKRFFSLEVGQTFELPSGQSCLIGRADLGTDTRTIRILELQDNQHISNYALRIQRSEHGFIIGQVDQTVNGEHYSSSNQILVKDTLGQYHEVDDEYDTGAGINLDEIVVQDKESKSGFTLKLIGINKFKLSKVLDNGKLID